MLLAQLLDGLDDLGVAPWLAHGLGGVVGVAPRAVPVPGDGLGVKGHNDAKLLTDAGEQVTGDPEVVAGGNADAWADLESARK